MNWDQVEGQWHQLKGKAREHWGKLTDSDLEAIKGQRDQLVGRIQEVYGKRREEAEQDVDEWRRQLR